MIGKKKLLAIVTARGGSKRLPGKNTLKLAGKPMMAWSIEAALKSKYIDKVLVTTEDEVIANIAREFGAEVPFMRPNELASDSASSIDTVIHAIQALKDLHDDSYEYSPDGAYIWYINVRDFMERKFQYKGIVVLLK